MMCKAVACCSVVLACWLSIVSFQAKSQSTPVIHYNIQEGLPSSEVYEVYQDKVGFVWFATDNGVVRFDGKNFRTFQAGDGLPDPVVFGMLEDFKGRLWFRSYSGQLSWYRNDSIFRFAYNDSLVALCRHHLLRTMHVDSSDRIHFTTDELTAVIDQKGKITQEQLYPNQEEFWRAGNECLVVWRGSTYVSAENILYEIRNEKMNMVYAAPDVIISLSVDKKDNFWIGYVNSDVERFTTRDFKSPTTPDFLKGKAVTRVLQDGHEGFWFSTLKSGVFFVPHFDYFKATVEGLSKVKNAVSSKNSVLMVDDRGILVMVNEATRKKEHSTVLEHKSVTASAVDGNKNVWVSSEKHISIFDSMLRPLRTVPIHIRGLYIDPDKTMWGFDNLRVMSMKSNAELDRSYVMNTIHRSMIYSKPYFIMAGRTGFDVFDSDFKLLFSPSEYKDLKISKLTDIDDSTFLISTIGSGFFVVNKKSWVAEHYSDREHFVAQNIYSVEIVDSMLWIATEKGVAIASIKAIVKKHPVFRFLTAKSGLIDDRVDLLLPTANGVWIFSGNGYCVVPRNAGSDSRPFTRFYIQDIRVNNERISLSKRKEFPAENSDIRISFGFIDFTNQNIYVRSRLLRNAEWQYSSDRVLHYDRLAPGSYEPELEYSIDTNEWHAAPLDLKFKIAAPWWQRWYSQSIFFVFFLLIGYGIFRIRIVLLQQRNERLTLINSHKQNLLKAEIETTENERSRIAKDLHDGAGMNLTMLKLRIYQLFKKHPEEESKEVLNGLDTTITEIRDLIHNLAPSGLYRNGLGDVLNDYIQRNLSDLGPRITMFSAGEKIIDRKISLLAFRIIQELIGNSLKHSGASHISIHLNAFSDNLNILYEDNGKGFDLYTVRRNSGLFNIESRLELVNGMMEFSSDKNGVSYSINIPLNGSGSA